MRSGNMNAAMRTRSDVVLVGIGMFTCPATDCIGDNFDKIKAMPCAIVAQVSNQVVYSSTVFRSMSCV